MKRTHYAGALREQHVGMRVTVTGWVQTKRDMGGVVFIDLRDREGTLQTVFDAAHLPQADFSTAEGLKNESVVAVSGLVRIRSEETYNPLLETGTIELKAERLELLSEAAPLPFPIEDGTAVREELRLKYRFLDIRRPAMLKNLRFRHRTVMAVRDYLDADGFVEVETPILTKSTPEGARDYLVPSRVHPGTFYALPQSPQIFKQLLMVGGVDKYYQLARCFRDEDLRADRQPEFTQVDMELSFIDQEDILQHLERLFKHIFREMMGVVIDEPFPRITWQEAMDRYGSDKPDLRFGLPIVDVTDIAAGCGFSVFRSVAKAGGVVRAINVPGGNDLTRTAIEELTALAQRSGAKGMAWIALRPDGEIYSILTKFMTQEEIEAIVRRVGAKPGDFILFCADRLAAVRRVLGVLRLALGDMLSMRKKDDYRFLIVTDFPQFEYSEEEGRFVAMHHPFTMPYEEDIPYLLTQPERVRAQAYDVVLNGVELGSGSMRIHRRDVQEKMFEALGFSKEEAERRFGFMMGAFQYGTPPHGGFAFGLDRLVMLMLGASSLREVVAFPKLKDASCPMTSAPDFVDEEQLKVLSIGGGKAEEDPQEKAQRRARTEAFDVDAVARLARLELNEKEREAFQSELGGIIAFADSLSALDLTGVEPTAHVAPIRNVFRPDEAAPSFERAQLLQNAPSAAHGMFAVPKTVE